MIEKTNQFETSTVQNQVGVAIDSYEQIMAEQARNDIANRSLTISGLKKKYDDGTEAVLGINLKMFAD